MRVIASHFAVTRSAAQVPVELAANLLLRGRPAEPVTRTHSPFAHIVAISAASFLMSPLPLIAPVVMIDSFTLGTRSCTRYDRIGRTFVTTSLYFENGPSVGEKAAGEQSVTVSAAFLQSDTG